MKWMIASDIHGSAYYCQKTLEAFRRETPRLGFWLDNSRLTVEGSVEKILEHFSA